MYFHLNSNSRHESCQEKQLIEYNETGIINSEQFRAGTSGAPLNANISKAFISPTFIFNHDVIIWSRFRARTSDFNYPSLSVFFNETCFRKP